MFKKKPPIRFWSTCPGVKDCHPIIPATKLKRNIGACEHATKQKHASKCPGIKLYGNLGFILPMPCDLIIKTNGDMESVDWEAPTLLDSDSGFIGVHDGKQAKSSAPPNSINSVIKIGTTWRVSARKDIVFIQSPVLYNGEQRFTAATGLLDPSKVPQLNAQLYWHIKEGETLIEAGTPLLQLTPILRDSLKAWEYVVEDATAKDMRFENAINYSMDTKFKPDTPSVVRNNSKIIKNYYD